MDKVKNLIIFFSIFFSIMFLEAEEEIIEKEIIEEEITEYGLEKLSFNFIAFPNFTGIVIPIRIKAPNKNLYTKFNIDFNLKFGIKGFLEKKWTYYFLDDKELVQDPNYDFGYNVLSVKTSFALYQGLLLKKDKSDNLLEYVLRYKFEVYQPLFRQKDGKELIKETKTTDKDTVIISTINNGILFDNTERDKTSKVFSGSHFDFGIEYALPQGSNYDIHYIDIGAVYKQFVPFVEILNKKNDLNLFSMYFASSLRVDYKTGLKTSARGQGIPLYEASDFGGVYEANDSDIVLSAPSNKYNYKLLTALSLELRSNFTSIPMSWAGKFFKDRPIAPGFFIYFDTLLYAFKIYPEMAKNFGVTFTTGGGLSIEFFRMFEIVFYAGYTYEKRSNGKNYLPFGFSFGFSF